MIVQLTAALSLFGCAGDGPGTDGGLELGHIDQFVDGAVDAGPDTAPDGASDGARDLPGATLEAFDLPSTDARLSSARVIYLTSQSGGRYAMRETMADGSAPIRAIPGLSGGLSFEELRLTGLQPAVAIPGLHTVSWGREPLAGVSLAQGRGMILSFHNAFSGTSGLLHLQADGTVRRVMEVPGLYKGLIAPRIAIDVDTRRAAIVISKRRVVVFSLDGQALGASGEQKVELKGPDTVSDIDAGSLQLIGDWVVAVGETKEGTRVLLRGLMSASADLDVVALGADGTVTYVGTDALAVPGSNAVVVRAGVSSTAAELRWVHLDNGEVEDLSRGAAELLGLGSVFGGEEARIAVSLDGAQVAFVAVTGGRESLYLAKRAGGSPVEVTPADGMVFESGGPLVVTNVSFAADGSLLFMAGINGNQLDVFRYRAADGVQNLTGIGAGAAPFDGRGGLAPQTAFWNRDRSALLFFAYGAVYGDTNLWAVDAAAGTGRALTSGRAASVGGQSLAYCQATERLYFVARTRVDLFQQELHEATTIAPSARQLTALAGVGFLTMGGIVSATNCDTVFFDAGPGMGRHRRWRFEVGTRTARPINVVPRYVGPAALTPDGSTLVYPSGGDPDNMTLKATLSIGGPETVLDSGAGSYRVLGVF